MAAMGAEYVPHSAPLVASRRGVCSRPRPQPHPRRHIVAPSPHARPCYQSGSLPKRARRRASSAARARPCHPETDHGRRPQGATPLHSAANNEHLAAVKRLVERGADVNAETLVCTQPPVHFGCASFRSPPPTNPQPEYVIFIHLSS
jgi:hypothetical protein